MKVSVPEIRRESMTNDEKTSIKSNVMIGGKNIWETKNTMDKCENQIAISNGKFDRLRGFFTTAEIPFKHETCFHAQLFVWKSIGGLTVSCNRERIAAAKIPVSISILHESLQCSGGLNSSIKCITIAVNCQSLNC